jgi:hypothetical protein
MMIIYETSFMRKGFLPFISNPFPSCERADSNTFWHFRNPKHADGVLTDRISKTNSLRRQDDNNAGTSER